MGNIKESWEGVINLIRKLFWASFILCLALIAIFIYRVNILAKDDGTVRICHSTGSEVNPYVENYPDKSANVQGHDGHENDIIPPFDWYQCPSQWWKYTSFNSVKPCKMKILGFWKYADKELHSYPGKNWTTENQEIWNNGCQLPTPTATPTPEPTATPEPTCDITSWTCEECQIAPADDLCYKDFINYCGENYGCGWEDTCEPSDVLRVVTNGFHGEWLCEDTCELPDPTPAPTPEPKGYVELTPAGAPYCFDTEVMKLPANVHVYRKGGTAIVKWYPTSGNMANIYYREVGNLSNAHSVINTDNDGYEEINILGSLDWEFGVQQTKECNASGTVWVIDGLTSDWVLFRFDYAW